MEKINDWTFGRAEKTSLGNRFYSLETLEMRDRVEMASVAWQCMDAFIMNRELTSLTEHALSFDGY